MSILGYLRSNHIVRLNSIQIRLHEVCQLRVFMGEGSLRGWLVGEAKWAARHEHGLGTPQFGNDTTRH